MIAYVFRFNGSTWVQERKLVASGGVTGDLFGTSVAIDGDTIVVGATNDDDNGPDFSAASVFHKVGSTWIQEQKLLGSDGAAYDSFGYSVAVSGDVAVVGALLDNRGGLVVRRKAKIAAQRPFFFAPVGGLLRVHQWRMC